MSMVPKPLVHLITSLGGGGTENFLYQILAHSPAGFEHSVLYLRQDGVNADKIRRLGIPVQKTNPMALYRLLNTQKPPVFHTCLYWGNQVGRLVGRAAKVPFILSSQRAIDVWESPWHRILDRWTLPLCQAVVVNSDAAKNIMEARLRPGPQRPSLHKVVNGVDFDAFKRRDTAQARQHFNLPPNAVVGGTLMRLHAEKGAEKIPAFAKALLEKNPQLYLLIGGAGPMEAGLRAKTRALERVRWVGWQEDPARFLSALDFFWLLSREESFPQALLEASAAGLPWVAPDVGGVRELANAGASGLLYPSKDLPAAVANACNLLARRESYQEAATQAVSKLKDRFSLDRMVRDFYAVVGSGK